MDKIDEERWILDCGHFFHRECISTWLNRRSSCPICRQKITRNQEVVCIYVMLSGLASAVMFLNNHLTDTFWMLCSVLICIHSTRRPVDVGVWSLYGLVRIIVLSFFYDSCATTMALHMLSFTVVLNIL